MKYTPKIVYIFLNTPAPRIGVTSKQQPLKTLFPVHRKKNLQIIRRDWRQFGFSKLRRWYAALSADVLCVVTKHWIYN